VPAMRIGDESVGLGCDKYHPPRLFEQLAVGRLETSRGLEMRIQVPFGLHIRVSFMRSQEVRREQIRTKEGDAVAWFWVHVGFGLEKRTFPSPFDSARVI